MDITIPKTDVDYMHTLRPVNPTEAQMKAMPEIKKSMRLCSGKKLKESEVYDVHPLFDGDKKGKFGDSSICVEAGSSGDVDKTNEDESAVKKDVSKVFNEKIRTYQYGRNDVIADPEKLGASEYLLMDYGRGEKQVLRGVFGKKDANYAGYQEWSKDNPTVKLNLAVDYTTLPY